MRKGLFIPLKVKMILLVNTLLFSTVAVYTQFATSLFKQDKSAYVLENTLLSSRLIAKEIDEKVERMRDPLEMVILSGDSTGYGHSQADQIVGGALQKKGVDQNKISINPDYDHLRLEIASLLTTKIKSRPTSNGRSLQKASLKNEEIYLLEYDLGPRGFLRGIVQDDFFQELVDSENTYDTFVFSEIDGSIWNSSKEEAQSLLHDWIKKNQDPLENGNETSQITELANGERWVLSRASLQSGSVAILTAVPQTVAFSAAQQLVDSSYLFALILGCIVSAVSILFSRRLTLPLRKLFLATQKIASGEFELKLQLKENDEIGSLGKSVSIMAEKILGLLEETKEKAVLEKELETAHLVQDNLFPNSSIPTENNLFSISSYFQTASQCGGDWCDYFTIENKTFCLIGDATGHGVPSALITAAAHSATTVFKKLLQSGHLTDTSPAFLMTLLNHAITQAGKGKIKMTFFVLAIDHQNQRMDFCNASHDWPIIIQKPADNSKAPSKKDLDTFDGPAQPALGEDPNFKFESSSRDLTGEETVFLYTDGLIEQRGQGTDEWGERRLIRSLLKSATQDVGLIKNSILSTWSDYITVAPVADDVTFLVLRTQPHRLSIQEAA